MNEGDSGSKGAETRANIVRCAAQLFNEYGYSGVAMSDIMEVTGLRKGGLYNHFSSKSEIAEAAFNYAVEKCRGPIVDAVFAQDSASEKLRALLRSFKALVANPPIRGGCPVMNTAVEASQHQPNLYQWAERAMAQRTFLVAAILDSGVASGEFRRELKNEETAQLMISSVHGALVLCKLHQSTEPMDRTVAALETFVLSNLLVRKTA